MKTYSTRRNTESYQTMEYQNELHKNPHIEVLYSDPPQLRVNGEIIPWPQGKTPEEAYQDYLERESKPVPLNQLSEEELSLRLKNNILFASKNIPYIPCASSICKTG